MASPAHAFLGASSAHRWLNCPPSALASDGVADTPTDAALQGTAAHQLAEYKLLTRLGRDATRPTSEWVDAEMEEHTDEYVTYVLEQYAAAKAICVDAQIFIEQRLDYSHLAPGGFGTGDCVIVAEPTLHVIDFKYGQGIEVSPVENPQLMLYGLGALAAFGHLFAISEVRLTIFQPRRGNVESWSIKTTDLQVWGERVVKPVAALAAKGKGDYKAGAWCKFCRIAATCRARADHALTIARDEFRKPAELSVDEIAALLTRIPELKAWATDVETWALAQATNGTSFPGFKLVAGRSMRRYTDETAVADAAIAAGFTDIFERKLIGIGAMERLMGKKTFTDTLGDLVEKPAGKPTLVPETDKRPPLTLVDAASDFGPTETNENKVKGSR